MRFLLKEKCRRLEKKKVFAMVIGCQRREREGRGSFESSEKCRFELWILPLEEFSSARPFIIGLQSAPVLAQFGPPTPFLGGNGKARPFCKQLTRSLKSDWPEKSHVSRTKILTLQSLHYRADIRRELIRYPQVQNCTAFCTAISI